MIATFLKIPWKQITTRRVEVTFGTFDTWCLHKRYFGVSLMYLVFPTLANFIIVSALQSIYTQCNIYVYNKAHYMSYPSSYIRKVNFFFHFLFYTLRVSLVFCLHPYALIAPSDTHEDHGQPSVRHFRSHVN